MAARKQFLNVPEADPELVKLLDASRSVPITAADLQEQRVSFAYGNAPASEHITKASVLAASSTLLLV